MAPKKLNAKSTKAEILTAYNELMAEKQSLEKELATPQPSPLQPAPAHHDSQLAIIQDLKQVKPTAPTNPQAVDTIIKDLNRLQFNFGGAASDLSEQLTSEVLKLQDIQSAIADASTQLETLHHLQFTDDSLTTLIDNYETSAKAFREAFEQRQEELELELEQSKQDWTQAQAEHERGVKERNDRQAKLRQRDATEYNYGLALERRISDETDDQTETQRYQALDDLKESQAKQWADREQAIAEREQEFVELQEKVKGLPDQLEKATKKAKEEGKGIAHHQAKIKADLVAQEVAGQQRTYELRIESLQDQLDTQSDRIATLSNQLNAALKQVQDLAIKAIEGAANLSSLKSIREIAIEQAKNPSKNK